MAHDMLYGEANVSGLALELAELLPNFVFQGERPKDFAPVTHFDQQAIICALKQTLARVFDEFSVTCHEIMRDHLTEEGRKVYDAWEDANNE